MQGQYLLRRRARTTLPSFLRNGGPPFVPPALALHLRTLLDRLSPPVRPKPSTRSLPDLENEPGTLLSRSMAGWTRSHSGSSRISLTRSGTAPSAPCLRCQRRKASVPPQRPPQLLHGPDPPQSRPSCLLEALGHPPAKDLSFSLRPTRQPPSRQPPPFPHSDSPRRTLLTTTRYRSTRPRATSGNSSRVNPTALARRHTPTRRLAGPRNGLTPRPPAAATLTSSWGPTTTSSTARVAWSSPRPSSTFLSRVPSRPSSCARSASRRRRRRCE